MRIALDTNRYVDLIAGVPDTKVVLERATQLYLPFAVVAELLDGFKGGTMEKQNRARLDAFLKSGPIHIVFPDSATAEVWSTLSQHLRRNGRSISHNDLWIASICMQHGLYLYTRDSDFDHLPQVMRA